MIKEKKDPVSGQLWKERLHDPWPETPALRDGGRGWQGWQDPCPNSGGVYACGTLTSPSVSLHTQKLENRNGHLPISVMLYSPAENELCRGRDAVSRGGVARART